MAAYRTSIWQCYRHSGLAWALLVAVLPGVSQAFRCGVMLHDAEFFTPYSYLCLGAVLGLGLAGLLGGRERSQNRMI